MARIAGMGLATGLWIAGVVHGQSPPDYGIQWSTIGAPGNPAYPGPDPYGNVIGRGSVGYEYRIGTYEVTTQQWMEFVNTYTVRGGDWTWFSVPSFWGADNDPTYSGPGQRFSLRNPQSGMLPVVGLTWRQAAMYCNWLCNARDPSPEAIAHGAYDTSTFTQNPDGTFNDQRTHTPGAAFWIPTLDEWLKATHYDPDGNGPGSGRWWQYPNGSDTPLISGLPGEGQTSAGLDLPGPAEYDIPLGAYPDVRTPWGLLDASGGSEEWIEQAFSPLNLRYRGLMGSYAGTLGEWWLWDLPYSVDALWPNSHAVSGFRIASIPAPATAATLGIALLVSRRKRR
jgi:hypothetical protein